MGKLRLTGERLMFEKWAREPVGIWVDVTLNNGNVKRTRTHSAPTWAHPYPDGGGHTAVIEVQGICGKVLLSRVRKAVMMANVQAAAVQREVRA